MSSFAHCFSVRQFVDVRREVANNPPYLRRCGRWVALADYRQNAVVSSDIRIQRSGLSIYWCVRMMTNANNGAGTVATSA